jgi:hypothetical protein
MGGGATMMTVLVLMLVRLHAQGVGSAARTPKEAAPIDLTGYWVAVVTEDWRFRMVTPAVGDFQGVPMTPEAARIANAWDPGADEKAGLACKSYGAPTIMHVPARFHITWQDDTTLRMDVDAGTQTRQFHFNEVPGSAEPSWQGDSRAQWEIAGGVRAANAPPRNGSLKVVTRRLRPGYLRKNGVPYSANAVLTEYFDIVRERSGAPWMVVTSVVEDPLYLQQPYITSLQFKKQTDAGGWEPTPCSAVW